MLTLDKIYHAAFVLRDVARRTDLIAASRLNSASDLYLKTENLQVTGSFKVRGAYYKISQLTAEERAKGVIACSAGNHAQGVALAATSMGIKSVVCMPDGAPLMKVESTKRLGAQAFGAFHLHQRRAVRHADNALDAHAGGGQCHALCMVARRAGDHAFGALLCGQLADFVISATHLKAAGHLQVLGFQVQVTRAVQPRCRNQIRAACNVTQNKRGMVDLIQCKH